MMTAILYWLDCNNPSWTVTEKTQGKTKESNYHQHIRSTPHPVTVANEAL